MKQSIKAIGASNKTKAYSLIFVNDDPALVDGLSEAVEQTITEKYTGEYVEGSTAYETMSEREYETLRAYYRLKVWEQVVSEFPQFVQFVR